MRKGCNCWDYGCSESTTNWPTIFHICLLHFTDPKLPEESLAYKLVRDLEVKIGQKKSSKSAVALICHYEAWCAENKVNSFPTCYETLGGYLASRVLTLNGSTKSVDVVKAAIRNESLYRTQEWLSESCERKLRRLIARMKFDDTNPVRRVNQYSWQSCVNGWEAKI